MGLSKPFSPVEVNLCEEAGELIIEAHELSIVFVHEVTHFLKSSIL